MDRVLEALSQLEQTPRPHGVKKLSAEENAWRLRCGDWRIIYEIHDDRLLIIVIRIAHRREAYR
ncbi:MAG: type II toxin-antitoxin system RelE/ParE family toxin [Candidatus Sumerlaeota bacterium]|nr:type II toxin-antitoxin system RelE/ParE family toxin [Candidatus Sumerlaeota bacterium]